MTKEAYCYHCRRYHPKEEVVRVESSRGVKRWRCRKSIVSTQTSQEERDGFGVMVSEMNRNKYSRSLPRCIALLLGVSASSHPERI